MPKISVIVPIYKVEPYISCCVDSILSQSFTDYELILVDDGSPDNCGKICDEYAQKDKRIKVIHKENGGLSSARNAGIEYAVSYLDVDWLCFIDGDDYVSPYYLEHLVKTVNAFPNSYVYGGMITANYSHNELLSVIKRPPYEDSAFDNIEAFFKLQIKGYVGYACNSLFSSEIIKQYSLRFSYDVVIEDLPFVLSYIKYIDGLAYTGYCDYFYRTDERETLSKKYYPETFKKWAEKFSATVNFINANFDKKKHRLLLTEVSNYYLTLFLASIENTFDKRNKRSIIKKIKYNKEIIKSGEFLLCVRFADTAESRSKYVKMLCNGKYVMARFYRRVVLVYNRIKKGW